jgi:hypothetical protein
MYIKPGAFHPLPHPLHPIMNFPVCVGVCVCVCVCIIYMYIYNITQTHTHT